MPRRLKSVALGGLLLGLTPLVAAQPATESLSIQWSAPPGCGSSEELRSAVERLLRPDLRDRQRWRFSASVYPAPDGSWELTLQGVASHSRWTRQLRGGSCAELRDAAAVLMALSIDPSSPGHPAPNESPAPPAAAGPPSPVEASPNSSRAAFGQPAAPTPLGQGPWIPRPTAAWGPFPEFALAARGGLALGVLPRPAPAFFFGAMRGWGRWELLADIGWLVPQTGYVTANTKGGRIRLWLGSLQAGYLGIAGQSELTVSGGLQVGYMYGDSVGLRPEASGGGPWVAALARLALATPSQGRWGIVLSTEVWAPFYRPEFLVNGNSEVLTAKKVGGMVGVGARFRVR